MIMKFMIFNKYFTAEYSNTSNFKSTHYSFVSFISFIHHLNIGDKTQLKTLLFYYTREDISNEMYAKMYHELAWITFAHSAVQTR